MTSSAIEDANAAERARIEREVGGEASDVSVANIFHRYGKVDVLHDVSIEITHGELMTLLGPSGSGKSTLLRIIGGLEHPRTGVVKIGGTDVTALLPERREVGIVFQNYALFPHMTVDENIAFPLRMRRVERRDAKRQAAAMLEMVGLAGMGSRRPLELSGGQQQRVAVARALVFRPRVLLLDEPFGALDRRLREQLGLEVRRVQRELGITTVFVTHDQDEAFTMSTRIAVMGEGKILQVDAPRNIYGNPARLEVARGLGYLNEFELAVARSPGGGTVLQGPGGLTLPYASQVSIGDVRKIRCGVRPEQVKISREGDGVSARVQAAIFGGDSVRVQVVIDGTELLAVLPNADDVPVDGDAVLVSIAPGDAMLFDEETGNRLV